MAGEEGFDPPAYISSEGKVIPTPDPWLSHGTPPQNIRTCRPFILSRVTVTIASNSLPLLTITPWECYF